MRKVILSRMDFRKATGGWSWPPEKHVEITRAGCIAAPPAGKSVRIDGAGVHTRLGDSIELAFQLLGPNRGSISLGLAGFAEHIDARLDLAAGRIRLWTSEWDRRQPVAAASVKITRSGVHTLKITKSAGAGRLVKMTNVRVLLDGQPVLAAEDINAVPEMGVRVSVSGTRVGLRKFVHRGLANPVPEYFHVGGWQMLNVPDIDANLASLRRGLRAAAEQQIRLLVTPETSLTGLFPRAPITKRPAPIATAERKLRRAIGQTAGAPYLIVGLPVWRQASNGRQQLTRYNVSRVYDPDGHVILDGAKIHSCEAGFWHGYRLNEFEIDGAPICMHVCHDGRYPDVWTLPVMFGSRLVIHPANGGLVSGSVDALESRVKGSTGTSHAFYMNVSGGGGSSIAGPQKFHNILALSDECRRDNPSFPMCGQPQECLIHANIRLHDAYGYWPVRSFRASEHAAQAYVDLYRSLGGKGAPVA